MTEADEHKFNTLLSVGMLTSLLVKVDDAALDDIIAHHDDDFAYMRLCQAIRQFKRTINGPPDDRAKEDLIKEWTFDLKADGIIMVIVKEERAEVVGGFRDEDTIGYDGDTRARKKLPGMLRDIADEVEKGGGAAVGDHGKFYRVP